MAYSKQVFASGDAATYTWANKVENALEETAKAPTKLVKETLTSSLAANTNKTVTGGALYTGRTLVIRDGIYQHETDDYVIVNSTTIKFTYNIPAGSVLEFRFPGV